MKQITNKTILKQGDKTYTPVEVDGVVYWVDPALPIEEVYPHIVIEKLTTGDYMLLQIDTINDIDRSCQYQIVAQSQPRIEGIPVVDSYVNELTKLDLIHLIKIVQKSEDYKSVMGINLENTLKRLLSNHKSNPNQYTQKDIEEAIRMGRDRIYDCLITFLMCSPN